jgi:hypothetical protein
MYGALLEYVQLRVQMYSQESIERCTTSKYTALYGTQMVENGQLRFGSEMFSEE